MHKFETKAACQACSATGLYVGMAERDGFAVVCHHCKGSGEVTLSLAWEDFTGRKKRKDVKRVLQVNPGIVVGGGLDFGGLSYSDWLADQPFASGTEMRAYVCPAWWFQSADYSKKPDWDDCLGIGAFRDCDNFCKKEECWRRWDRENP